MGALFNHMHEKIGALRKRRLGGPSTGRKVKRILDVLVMSLLTSAVMFSLSTWLGAPSANTSLPKFRWF
jgi:hypothetical protein